MEDVFDIRDIIRCFLYHNNLSIKYMARKTGIKEKTLRSWMERKRNISGEKMKKAYSFLQGDFLLSIDKICDALGVDIDNAPLDELVKLFMEYNDLSMNKISKYARIPGTTLRNFLNGTGGLREQYAIKLREILKGEYLITFETCCAYLMIHREEKENES